MKNNYPIKYALMPIEAHTGWDYGLSAITPKYENIYYIVSKCFIISESTKYERNGRERKNYKIAFPLIINNNYKEIFLDRNKGLYGLHETYVDTTAVDEVFDTFENAQKRKNEKNEKVFLTQINKLVINDKLDEELTKLENEFNNLAKKYDQIETMIENNTQELTINAEKKEQTTIANYHGIFKKFKESLYSILDLYDDDDYIVYSLSKLEYLELEKEINNPQCNLSKYNHTPLLINDPKSKIIKLYGPNTHQYIYQDQIIDEKSDYIEPKEHEIIIYTIEDYNDIVNSFLQTEKNAKKLVLK